ncbi:hypothetical protein [Kitasatospora sp. NPDC058046]|uniref:hypothetical protein n=1 Tax=Kitasatospora sp. NPDC058046 TaxID=3346312 RepID=UPI0036D872DC
MSIMNVTVTNGADEVVEIVSILPPASPAPDYRYTDVDGDSIVLIPASVPGQGAAVNVVSSRAGCSIPTADLEPFIAALRASARDAVALVGTVPGEDTVPAAIEATGERR